MEIPSSPLILTKFRVPVLREHLIYRDRLCNLLDDLGGNRLLLICAPAGYGKTTLLVDWAHLFAREGIAVIWYGLDNEDDDPIPFKAYLVASLLQALGPLPELVKLSQLLRTTPEIEMKFILTTIINVIQSCGRKCVLILDDYHLIGSPAIHGALSFLIEHLPENLRITVSSRADPPLPLARLRARGQLREIRSNDLRFTEEETGHFLRDLMQLNLSLQDIQLLEDRTEGWITGLQLAALSLSDRIDKTDLVASFSGGHRYLVEYLMEEVVDQQPAEIQTFMTSTSMLDRLCAPLCDHVLHSDRVEDEDTGADSSFSSCKSQEILEFLEKVNLFLVPLDEDRTWYRYHHLFREFLLARLKKTQPVRISTLHKLACEWFAKRSFIREASGYAFQTGDWEYAASFVENFSFTLITHSDLSTIHEWCSKFPEEVMQKHPILCLQQALTLAYSLHRKNQYKIEMRLLQADQMVAISNDKQLIHTLNDLSAVVRTFIAFAPDPHANPQELLALSQAMIDNNPEEDAGQFSGLLLRGYAQMALQDTTGASQTIETARQIALREQLYFGIVEASFHLACMAQGKGQLKQVAEICLQSKTAITSLLPQSEKGLPAIGCLDIVLGCMHLEKNELESAEQCLHRGLELMGAGMIPYYLMTAYLALFRLYEIQSRAVEALKYLAELDAVFPDFSFYTAGLRIMRQLRANPKSSVARERVRLWCEDRSTLLADANVVPGLGPFGGAEIYYLARLLWIKAQIAIGKAADVKPYLQKQLEQSQNHGLSQRVIEISLLNALVSESQGDSISAQISMEQALGLAQKEGYIRIFDQFPALNPILEKMALQKTYKEYVNRILTAIASPTPGDQGQVNKIYFGQTLSDREMEVLFMIARGATNQEIAEQLVVTVGTVKSHINHILTKLDSHNRTEAVAKARQVGLLEI